MLTGGAGDDLLYGGDGNDVYIFNLGDGNDVIDNADTNGAAADSLKLGAGLTVAMLFSSRSADDLVLSFSNGIDSITVRNHFTTSPLDALIFADGTVWDAAAMITNLATRLTAGNDTFFGSSDDDYVLGLAGNDIISGGQGNDILAGGTGADVLYGEDGNDLLFGGDGADRLYGGAGNDTMLGGFGNDIYVVNSTGEVVTENAGEGTDTVESSISLTLGDNLENLILSGTAALDGTGNELDNTLIGNSADNTLRGLAGNDRLEGGAGTNTLIGGSGNDVYVMKSSGDRVTENAGEGSDTVESAITYTLNANVENLTLTGSSAINGTGNELDNILTGNSAINILIGGVGNDRLHGGSGADIMIGGLGNDTYVVDNSSDVTGEYAGEGVDTVESYLSSYTLSANVENLTLLGNVFLSGTGNDLNNILTGNDAANTLSGQGGNDTLLGLAGNDFLYGGRGADILIGGAGNDTLDGGSYSLSDNDTLDGGDGDDTYIYGRFYEANSGSLGQDSITDSSGNDTIKFGIDGVGMDNVQLWRDNSNLYIGVAWTSNVLAVKGWFDETANRVESVAFVSEKMQNTAEIVWNTATLAGAAFRNYLYGTDGDDILLADLGIDILSGGIGNDTLSGGSGNDTMIGGIGNDTYLFNLGDGQDWTSDHDRTAGNLDILRFGEGIAASDITFARNGYDLILGIAGTNDQVRVRNWGYVPNKDYNSRIERIEFANGTVWDVPYVMSQIATIPIIGTAKADTLQAWADENATLQGLGGNDTLIGNNGNNTYLFNLGDGQDTISETAGDLDTIRFGAGIAASNITFSRRGLDLVLGINGTSDQVKIQNWGNWSGYRVERVEFADGTVWDAPYVTSQIAALPVIGTEGDDTLEAWIDENATLQGLGGNDNLFGNNGNDLLIGGAGDDHLDGRKGNDTFIGGVGNDYLNGGNVNGENGNDTYIFNRGDGQDLITDFSPIPGNLDTIRFGTGIAATDITFNRIGSSLILGINGSSDKIRIGSWGNGAGHHIEQVEFADGTTWNAAYIQSQIALLPPIVGTGDDDYLNAWVGENTILQGGAGADSLSTYFSARDSANNAILDGGTGDDCMTSHYTNSLIIGGTGSDVISVDVGNNVILYNRGDGQDRLDTTTWEESSTSYNTVSLGEGITYADLHFSREGGDLVLEIGENDRMTFSSWFTDSGSNAQAKRIKTLQIITEAMPGYDPQSTDQMLNQRVQQFDFLLLASQFEAAIATDFTIISWALAPHLTGAYLGGSNTEAIGGAMAYKYGMHGTLNQLTKTAMQSQLNDLRFGTTGQSLTTNITIYGGDGDDILTGGVGSESISAKMGNDVLTGGAGSDLLIGEDGRDVYVFNLGDGKDWVLDAAESGIGNIIKFGTGISKNDIVVTQESTILTIRYGTRGDRIQIAGFDPTGANGSLVVDTFEFADGSVLSFAELANHLPEVGDADLWDMTILQGESLYFELPVDTFKDADGDALLYRAVVSGSTELPAWLQFDPAAGIFSGTPGNDDVGSFEITVSAADGFGMSATRSFVVSVDNINDAPLLKNQLPDAEIKAGALFTYSVPSNTFTDPDKDDTIRLSATLADGNPLPSWLGFNTTTGTFTGTPDAPGVVSVCVTATDTGDLSESDVFDIVVKTSGLNVPGTAGADTLRGGNEEDFLSGLDGNDYLYGNDGADTLLGGLGNDYLHGGSGADSMLGGQGNDYYVVDNGLDTVEEDGDAGTDTVNASISCTLGVNVENLTLTGSAEITGTGNALNNSISGNSGANVLSGLDGNDHLYGNDGADTLLGGLGNDYLHGGSGADTMIGGQGNDYYVVDNELDRVEEDGDAGTDTVNTSISYTLGANVENLTLTGSTEITGTGNALNNSISGNSGANVLSGLDGDDHLYGNDGADSLLGGLGNDYLHGGSGADTMLGGQGNDYYVVDNGLDTVEEDGDAGTDTVSAAISYTLGANVENLTLTGSAEITGTGNALNNSVSGNGGANVLSGLDGNDHLYGNDGADTLLGGLGNDYLSGGGGNDIFIFDTVLNASTNKDTISDFTVGLDKIQLDKTIFTSLPDEGTLSAAYFKANSTGLAADDNDYFLYNTSTGALLYDADGSGQGVAVQFATLSSKPEVTTGDFLIVA
ncbi:MAG: calcium-binding protein [Pseudomonadota bacterium]